MAQTKVGPVTFVHNDDYTGEVEIKKGEVTLKVPFSALRTVVAESVRHEALRNIERMKPESLLSKLA